MEEKIKTSPGEIYDEYKKGVDFKGSLGKKGMYEQNKINERFYTGNQWYGVNAGSERPLVQYNIIKRIGEYKLSMIGSAPLAVNYSAEGIPHFIADSGSAQQQSKITNDKALDYASTPKPQNDEINFIMEALGEYHKTAAERLKLSQLAAEAIKNGYTTGTGVLYTYWDPDIKTGLYADVSKSSAIKGDIASEVLDIESVYFGDPNGSDVQKQPYIIIAQRKTVAELKREAKRYGMPLSERAKIVPDTEHDYMAGDMGSEELKESRKATVLTKFWKEWDKKSGDYTIKAVMCTKNAIVREEWSLGLRLYPISIFVWETKKNCIYGESEVTHLVPNQIAINRMISASVWSYIINGMPITVVNRDRIQDEITNDPGQVIKISGDENYQNYIGYINPPQFSPQMAAAVNTLVEQTLTQSGANDAALGNLRADNTSAIIALREAANAPLQMMQNRFYQFYEDTARIWAEFWITQYGKRSLKVEDETGIYYIPFDGDRYRDFVLSVKIDVGASTIWTEAQSIKTLDNLLSIRLITPQQYVERLPKGVIPKSAELIKEMNAQAQSLPPAPAPADDPADTTAAEAVPTEEIPPEAAPTEPPTNKVAEIIKQLSPEQQKLFNSLSEEKQLELLQKAGVTP